MFINIRQELIMKGDNGHSRPLQVQPSDSREGEAANRSKLENSMRNSYWLGGTRLYIVEGQTDTGGLYDLVEVWFPTGTQVSQHVHRRYDEQIYVLDGEFTLWTGKGALKTTLRPGNDIIIPAGTPHAVYVTRRGPGRALVVASPSAFARLIAQIGTPDEGRQPPSSTATETDLLLRLSAEAGDEILGPPGALPDFRQSSAPK
jgi:quercetin dioxygenase-like cupin family protein